MSNARKLSKQGSSPVFSAYQSSAQSLGGTLTKISLQSEDFDTASAFDTSTYRFTPQVSGYFQINGSLSVSTTAGQVQIYVYKNGSPARQGFNVATSAGMGSVSTLVYLNGSTDYVELYGAFSATQNIGGASLQGCLIKGG